MIEAPLLDRRVARSQLTGPLTELPMDRQPEDTLGRPLRDLRISVIDQCNFRCTYCMPREVFGADYPFLRRDELLTFDELERTARAFIRLGVRKIRLSGGEPLLRKDLEHLVARLARLVTLEGEPIDLAMTTNGALLARKAHVLAAAGLRRLNVSLDALAPATFARIANTSASVGDVLEGIATAHDAGIRHIKINMVVQRGVNDDQILPMARHFRGTGHTLRFIEFMDVGTTNGWTAHAVLPSDDVLKQIHMHFPLEPVAPATPGEVARRWRYLDGQGEIGLISSVSHPFCGDCSRARLSADGKLYTCLFAEQGDDIRSMLRAEIDDQTLVAGLAARWRSRSDRYSEVRAGTKRQHKIEMSYIGG
ncbi:GTP 3',8-cyclase MoaA [Achromobacter deleyi]|uniref:GTP 3',8-cyclase MoaA n=1 Tax=Achromobacter deleyi TaxID=1353891 RepID=UPI00180BFCD0